MHLSENHPYFLKSMEINTKFNDVILIGDQSNIKTFSDNRRIKHYHVFNLETDDTRDFRKYFSNYNTNSYEAEYTCFVRYFHYISIMDELGIDKIAVCDSDCVVLENVNKLWPVYMSDTSVEAAMTINSNVDNEHFDKVCSSVGFLTRGFCVKFIDLLKEIYLSQSKFHYIEPKTRWHAINEIPGGVSDMTVLTAMWENNLAKIENLTGTQIYDNEVCVFDWNLQNPAGFKGKDTYVMLQSGIKYAKKTTDGKFYFATKDMEYVRALSLHFQGMKSKALLQGFSV